MARVFSGLLRKNIVLFCLLQLIAAILYLPVLGNNLLADDYRVMNRVGLHGEVFVQGFFRPLSDISLYLNYLVAGLSPAIYYFTNIFFHACCSFMIYLLCRRMEIPQFSESKNHNFSLFAALLFLTYPFHNESIAWIVGRASLLATFFGLATLLAATSSMPNSLKFSVSAVFFFIGLSAYESIFPLPAIVLMLSWSRHKSASLILRWTFAFFIAIIIHLVLRIRFSGVVTGDYGQEIFTPDVFRYFSNLLKISGRMLLPPSDHSMLLAVLFVVLITGYLFSRFIKKPKPGLKDIAANKENQFLLMLAIALLVPLTFSVSTRTSEGDRLLYFPSVFLCIFLAFLLVGKIARPLLRMICLGCLLIYNIIFLEINNFHWKRASEVTDKVLSQVARIARTGEGSTSKRILLMNVPGEYKGAYIFRNAFEDALVIKGIDTAGVQAVNYLNHAEYQSLPDPITAELRNDSVFVGNNIVVAGGLLTVRDFHRPALPSHTIPLSGEEQAWFWNKNEFVLLPLR